MEQLSFEKAIVRLEEIVVKMDKGDLPLQEALELFEEGAALVSSCSRLLKEAEQVVVKLSTGGGELEEVPFGGDGDPTS